MTQGLAATSTDPLTDAQAQLATVSTYLNAAGSGTATSAQFQAAVQALTTAQTDILQAQGQKVGTLMPPGVWVKGSAVAGVAVGGTLAGGIVGWLLGKRGRRT